MRLLGSIFDDGIEHIRSNRRKFAQIALYSDKRICMYVCIYTFSMAMADRESIRLVSGLPYTYIHTYIHIY